MKLGELGERKVLEYIIYPFLKEDYRNEDSAIIDMGGGNYLIVNVDTFVKSTDAPPGMTYYQIGCKSVTMCVSDIIAKGAEPRFFLVSLVLPKDMDATDLMEIYRGLNVACKHYSCILAGGDTNAGLDIELTGIAIGFSEKPIYRRGLKPNQKIWVWGSLGFSAVALHYLLKGGRSIRRLREILNEFFCPLLNSNLAGVLRRIATAAMDSSDGVAASLNTLAELNGVRIDINPELLSEIDRSISDYAEANSLNPWDLILFGGEEYAIIFGSSLEPEEIYGLFKRANLKRPILLGSVSEGQGVFLNSMRIPNMGWEHFIK